MRINASAQRHGAQLQHPPEAAAVSLEEGGTMSRLKGRHARTAKKGGSCAVPCTTPPVAFCWAAPGANCPAAGCSGVVGVAVAGCSAGAGGGVAAAGCSGVGVAAPAAVGSGAGAGGGVAPALAFAPAFAFASWTVAVCACAPSAAASSSRAAAANSGRRMIDDLRCRLPVLLVGFFSWRFALWLSFVRFGAVCDAFCGWSTN